MRSCWVGLVVHRSFDATVYVSMSKSFKMIEAQQREFRAGFNALKDTAVQPLGRNARQHELPPHHAP